MYKSRWRDELGRLHLRWFSLVARVSGKSRKKTLINPNMAILYQISDGLKNWNGILMDFLCGFAFFPCDSASSDMCEAVTVRPMMHLPTSPVDRLRLMDPFQHRFNQQTNFISVCVLFHGINYWGYIERIVIACALFIERMNYEPAFSLRGDWWDFFWSKPWTTSFGAFSCNFIAFDIFFI